MYIQLRLLIPEYELPRATMILSGIWEQIWFPIARPRQASAVPGWKNATHTKSDRTGPEKSGGVTRSFVRGQGGLFWVSFFRLSFILYVISPYKSCTGICYCVLYIHPVQCARLFLDAWLVDWSARVIAHVRARVRIPLSAISSHLSDQY